MSDTGCSLMWCGKRTVPMLSADISGTLPDMPKRTLVLMRHAKSDWSGNESDLSRPIAPRGERQAAEAGRWLDTHLPGLELVVTSPAKRARSTWKVAGAECRHRPVVDTDERIYTSRDRDLLDLLRDIDDDISSALLVGHNPGLDELVTLTDRSAGRHGDVRAGGDGLQRSLARPRQRRVSARGVRPPA